MTTLQTLALEIRRGSTLNLPIRVESDTLVYKSITAMPQLSPVRVTAVGHGLTDGWRACMENIAGPTDLNASSHPPRDAALMPVGVVDADTVEFNLLNAAGMRPYKSGGQVVFYAPFDLSLYVSARLTVRDKVGGTVLLQLTTADATLVIDAVNNAVWLRMTDEATAALSFAKGVFDIELVDGAGEVTALCAADSKITVTPEITT